MIAGELGGATGPARTFTSMNVWDLQLRRDGAADLPLPDGHTAGLSVLQGTVLVNGADVARDGQFILLDRHGGDVPTEANNEAWILVLSGEPIDERLVMQGPFVMNSEGEIRQAMSGFQRSRFGRLQDI